MVRDGLLWPLEATFIEVGNKLLNGCVAFNTSYATSFLKMDLSSPFWGGGDAVIHAWYVLSTFLTFDNPHNSVYFDWGGTKLYNAI
jgi:hypothetical protein